MKLGKSVNDSVKNSVWISVNSSVINQIENETR